MATRMAHENGSATASKTKVKPIGDQILIRQTEAISMTPGGIALPDMAKERPKEGVVLAVGKGARSQMTGERIPLDVAVGDRVVFANYAGSEKKIDDEDLILLSEKDVLAVLS